ncbi:MAG: Mut7-C RNAse domain-containing protein [Desulfurococcales archaeon]|nr:Mut7-C RNAse domain-containing protein [Desulfurococcales archaeon]
MGTRQRFVADTMMGEVARWLRLLGYDVVYSRHFTDDEILRLASSTGRIIITRDKRLHRKAVKMGLRSVYVEAVESAAHRLAEISVKSGIEIAADPSKSRCPECNGELFKSDKERVLNKIPPGARNAYDTFYVCSRCGKVYWEGSHWKNIRRIVREARTIRDKMLARSKRRQTPQDS